MAIEVAKEAFLPALKYGASSPTRCDLCHAQERVIVRLRGVDGEERPEVNPE
jgi:hypothetical protein